MIIRVRALRRVLPISLLLLASPACAGIALEDVLAATGGVYGNPREVSGEISYVDARRQEIQVQSAWSRTERVRYDGRTEVVYRQRRYDVRDLQSGDLVRVRVDNRNGDLYASQIVVQQSAQDRYGSTASNNRIERLDGTVVRVDTQRGYFDLQQDRGTTVLVTLPYQPERSIRDRFSRLRRGDRIRIEGEYLNNNRVELRRFL